jgi:DhnA family fructose-bisphosphate aldolase class Ia
MTGPAPGPGTPALATPALVLAADHRARGVVTVEDYGAYLAAARAALAHCDGVLASAQPLADLAGAGALDGRVTYLSVNRTGLAGSSFELDDRLVASPARARAEGWSGVKVMVRIDHADPHTAAGLELLGRVLEAARGVGLDALVESVSWHAGAMARDTDAVVLAAVIAHDMGAPVLKVPVPAVEPGPVRARAVGRVVRSVGVPVLFLGGPRPGPPEQWEAALLDEVSDVMDGGGAGMALGRALLQHPDPGALAGAVAGAVHGR